MHAGLRRRRSCSAFFRLPPSAQRITIRRLSLSARVWAGSRARRTSARRASASQGSSLCGSRRPRRAGPRSWLTARPSRRIEEGLDMLKAVWRFRWRLAVGALCFFVGLLLASVYVLLAGLFEPRVERSNPAAPRPEACAPGEAFTSPGEVLAALKDEEVGVRREVFRRLLLRPGVETVYYDYERDKD